MEVSTQPECVICKKPIGDTPEVILGEKGSAGINKASKARNDSIHCTAGQHVHQVCRKYYCTPSQIAKTAKQTAQQDKPTTSQQALRSTKSQFNYSSDCFYCGEPAKMGRKRKDSDVLPVRTVETRDTILRVCQERGDEWANAVQARILHVHDLHAADAVYHKACSVNFRTMKQIPAIHEHETGSLKKAKVGRPAEKQRTDAFLEVAKFLEENDDEQITIYDLIQLMDEKLANTEHSAYSSTHMQQKLKEHFGNRIIQTEINGKCNVVTFRSKAREVLHDFYSQRDPDVENDKVRIIKTAAKLIKDDIKLVSTSHCHYPSTDEMSSDKSIDFLPESLRVLLSDLIIAKDAQVKIASIGQAIMQATRPRVLLAPLQIGLGVQLHHHYASRFLIDTLYKHGFCCSYTEVQRFEQNAVMSYGTDIPNYSSQFVQYIADNADHNTATLDGNETFHGMGMIAAITPETNKSNQILRAKVKPKDIAAIGRVPIQFYRESGISMTMITFEKLNAFTAQDSTAQLDVLWKTSLLFGSPRPAWSGMMQLVHHGFHPGKSSVLFLPMINMNPSNITCVYSTLKFIENHAHRHDVTPIITFDQPLWWKALMIIVSEPDESGLRKIVLRLGGFHTEMSFLGCIGHLMAGSGLQDVLELVYAPNTVLHMLSGKAIARAIRGHFMVDAVLNALILASSYEIHISALEMETEELMEAVSSDRKPDLDKAAQLYDKLMKGIVSAEHVCQDDVIAKISDALQEEKEHLKSCRTAALWLQYMDMIDILRKYIRAERTGNWALHLQAVSEMLPYLAASGHNNYTKSAWIYLQRMSHLQEDFPEVYNHFANGLHVIRQSDRYWAGLSSDLVIEQVLMRSMKSGGGLTRGRGTTEQQCVIWSLAMPACAEVNRAMQELTGVSFNSGEQNKDLTQSRQARDWKDIQKLLSYLQERNPFSSDPILRNICTGMHAHNTVNADTAKTVGNAILSSMENTTPADFTFKRSRQAVTLDIKTSVKHDGVSVQIDPRLLFQRLTIAAKASDEIEDIFKYELCSYPPALFDASILLREPQKPVLANVIWDSLTHDSPVLIGEVQYVLDGGSLLQRIPWTRGNTYREICTVYTQYVTKKYGEAIIVFDGYAASSTKDMVHQRRAKGQVGVNVSFTEDMKFMMKKTNFLANKENKQQFIKMLGRHLEKKCKVYYASGDADLLIVQKTVQSALMMDTALVGEDTDLLVLLCYHANMDSHNIFFRPEPKKAAKTPPKVWSIKDMKKQLGPEICKHILFLHALLGCDTTSQLYGIGKGASLKKFKISQHFQEQAAVFDAESASPEEIFAAGEQALVVLYNGKPGEKLDSLRYKRFFEKVATSTSFVSPQSLPPTSAAAKYHCFRVYFQILEWKGHCEEVSPLNWGWKTSDDKLMPVLTDLPPAPDELLKMIRCNCRTDCNSMRCMCRKHNLKCSPACGNCKGSACLNSDIIIEDEDEDEVEHMDG